MILFEWLNFREGRAFIDKIVSVSTRLGIHPDSLMAVLWIESEFNRKAVNPISGAFGLIQCLPSTLRGLGLTRWQVERMSGTEQLEKVVYPYLKPYAGKMHRPIDVYLAVFYPLAVGENDNYLIAKSGQTAYRWNKLIDTRYGDDDGRLEVFDIRFYLNTRIWQAVRRHRKDARFKFKICDCYEPNLF
jgi:hypothetical protein